MTREEAISVLERVAHTESKWPGTEDTLEALDMAISALRQQETAAKCNGLNEPLTLDDLREAAQTGYPVWLVGMEDGDGWVFVHHVDSLSVRYARVGDSKEWCFRTKSYGVRVCAYLDGPNEEHHDSD